MYLCVRGHVFVLGVLNLPLSMIFLLDFGTVPTVPFWYLSLYLGILCFIDIVLVSIVPFWYLSLYLDILCFIGIVIFFYFVFLVFHVSFGIVLSRLCLLWYPSFYLGILWFINIIFVLIVPFGTFSSNGCFTFVLKSVSNIPSLI